MGCVDAAYVRNPRLRFLGALAIALLGGCGSEKSYTVTGKVIYADNGKPLPLGGIIVLESMAPPHVRSSAMFDAEGNFRLDILEEQKGTIEGQHRVRIEPNFPDGPQSTGDPRIERAKILHPKHLDFETSELTCSIGAGENLLTIKVEKPPRR